MTAVCGHLLVDAVLNTMLTATSFGIPIPTASESHVAEQDYQELEVDVHGERDDDNREVLNEDETRDGGTNPEEIEDVSMSSEDEAVPPQRDEDTGTDTADMEPIDADLR